MSPIPTTFLALTTKGWLMRRALGGALLVALGDWLFYGVAPGLSLVVFVLALTAISAAINPVRARGTEVRRAVACVVAGAAPAVFDLNALSGCFLVAGAILGALLLASAKRPPFLALVGRMIRTPLSGPVRIFQDGGRVARFGRRISFHTGLRIDIAGWLVPVVFGGAFLALFSFANPVLEGWLSRFDFAILLELFNPRRLAFWFFLLAVSWPLLHLRAIRARVETAKQTDEALATLNLLPTAVVRRSLVVFNALFALQTALDLTYLWSGRALPMGMNYATYAHRGAYPLMATALLAGAFVLAATRGRDRDEASSFVTWLLRAFVAQNVLLVASSMLRLELYVGAYGLTNLRLAAGLWMGLVAFGLIAIVVQIETRRSRAWLLSVNICAAAFALYAVCFVNTPDVIARFNLAHALTADRGPGQADWTYLVDLGPLTLPALDTFIDREDVSFPDSSKARGIRAKLLGRLDCDPRDWRKWSFQAWRFDRYLARISACEGRV